MGPMYIEIPYISSHMGPTYIETAYISSHMGPTYIETPCTLLNFQVHDILFTTLSQIFFDNTWILYSTPDDIKVISGSSHHIAAVLTY